MSCWIEFPPSDSTNHVPLLCKKEMEKHDTVNQNIVMKSAKIVRIVAKEALSVGFASYS